MARAERAVAIIQYSPVLALSDFFLFPKMKEHLAGKRFASDEDLKDAVVTRLSNQAVTLYEEGTHKLAPRYDKWQCQRRLCRKVDKGMCQILNIKFLYYY